MAITEELLVKVSVDDSGTIKEMKVLADNIENVGKSSKKTSKDTENLEKSFDRTMATVVSLNQALELGSKIFATVKSVVAATTNAYAVQEKAETKLSNALKLVGADVASNLADFKEFASSLQNTTTIGDETTLSLVATGVALGRSNDQIKKMVEAASELDTAFEDVSFQTAFKNLNKTLGGTVGELGELLPEIKNLTADQLKAGAAIDLIKNKLNGFAAGVTETFSGRSTQAMNAFGDLLEEIGKTFVETFNIKNLLVSFTSNINNAIQYMVALRQALNTIDFGVLSQSIGQLATILGTIFLPYLVKTIAAYSAMAISAIAANSVIILTGTAILGVVVAIDQIIHNLENLKKALQVVIKFFGALGQDLKSFILEVVKVIGGPLGKAFEKMGLIAEGTTDSLKNSLDRQIENLNQKAEDLTDSMVSLSQSMEYNGGAVGNIFEQASGFIKGFNVDLKGTDDQLKAIRETASKVPEEVKGLGFSSPSNDTQKTDPSYNQSGTVAVESVQLPKLFNDSDIAYLQEVLGSGSANFAQAATDIAAAPLAMAGAANMFLDAAQALVDFIPQILEKISHLLNSFTELPLKILEGVKDVFKSIVNLIENYIPNLIKGIGGIIKSILISFAKSLPNAFIKLFSELPSIIEEVVSDLIDAMPEIVKGLIQAMPKISAAFLKYLIVDLPKLSIAIIKAIVQSIPGILGAMRDAIFGIFDGSLFDTSGMVEEFAQVGDVIARASSQLFSVIDDQSQALGANAAEQIATASEQATTALKILMQKIIDGIVNSWRWVYDNVISPLGSILWKAWLWVYDHIVQPLGSVVSSAWKWVVDNVLSPIGSVVSSAWKWVVDNVLSPIGGVISSAWKFLIDFFSGFEKMIFSAWEGILSFFNNIGKIFAPVFDPIFKAFNSIVKLFKDIFDPFLDFFKNTFSGIFDKLFKGVSGFFDGIGKAFSSLFNLDFAGFGQSMADSFSSAIEGFTGGLKQFVNGLIGLLNGLKLPQVDVSGKVLSQKFSFTLIPAVDLIPGEIATLASGGLVSGENALKKGIGTDTVPALLTPGEFVVNKNAVNSLGLDTMNKLNKGNSIGSPVYNSNISVNLNVKNTGELDVSFIRSKILPALKDELKKASLKGEFIISNRGVQ